MNIDWKKSKQSGRGEAKSESRYKKRKRNVKVDQILSGPMKKNRMREIE